MVEMREHVKKELEKIWPEQGEELEDELYKCVGEMLSSQGMAGMDFYPFRKRYKTIFKSIMMNIGRDNSGFAEELGKSTWSEVISKDPREWEPNLWKVEVDEKAEEEEMRNGTFDCGNCARKGMYSKNTSHYEKQTRSADEPMTIFMHCHTCGKDYRFSS